MYTKDKNNINFLQNTEKETEKGKANIYCFYDIIL